MRGHLIQIRERHPRPFMCRGKRRENICRMIFQFAKSTQRTNQSPTDNPFILCNIYK